jgi:hypothetical protein
MNKLQRKNRDIQTQDIKPYSPNKKEIIIR